jgi:hypothetical protein
MEYRGLILIVFGGSLMLSPLAIKMAQQQQAAAAAPGEVQTDAQADAACDAASIVTRSYRLGCNRDTATASTRRVMSGGAVFVTAKN